MHQHKGITKQKKVEPKLQVFKGFFRKLTSSFVSYIWRIKLVIIILILPRYKGRKIYIILLAMQRINVFNFSSHFIIHIRVTWLFIIP